MIIKIDDCYMPLIIGIIMGALIGVFFGIIF